MNSAGNDTIPKHDLMKKKIILLLFFLIPLTASAQRPFPNTTEGIYVFNDQLAGWDMTEAQFEFAATHFVGTQKMIRSHADRLRAYQPDFIILHYRLGLGLGHRIPEENCQPSGEWIEIIEGNNWIREWPDSPSEDWFFHWDGQRVYHCPWGWYLMEPNNTDWRSYWIGEVLRQLEANDNDGLFADSYSVPNYLGAWDYDPPLPEVDATFESAWSDRIESLTSFVTEQFDGNYYFIPNVGSWITTRDATDYSGVDGVMIEGFGAWDAYTPFDIGDWKLQMNRILSLTNQDKILILQTYIDDPDHVEWRLFCVANYLLVKGSYSFINIDYFMEPEYFPEYDLDLGEPSDLLPANIDNYYDSNWDVYVRHYTKGMVLVNPGTEHALIDLGKTYQLGNVEGGGTVRSDGTIDGSLSYESVNTITLHPFRGAILLNTLESPDQVTELEVFHRSGQTFITWKENGADSYNMYRYTAPITSVNLAAAEPVASIAPNSGYYKREVEDCYGYDWGEECSPIGLSRFIIEDLGNPLPENTGFFVYTNLESGIFYYAITAVSNGIENRDEFSQENSLSTGLVETVQSPEPVLVWQSPNGTRRVYTHWMDYTNWNPSFEGYAYNFYVGVPLTYDGQTPFPLYFYIHAYTEKYRAHAWDSEGGSDYDWPVIQIFPDDRNNTWWYGFGCKADTGEPLENGQIVNYTEQRLLYLLDWLINRSSYNIDTNRIYLFGLSMGASGILNFGSHYPEYIAAIFANEGMTDYKAATNWDFSKLWGIREQNILTNEGIGVYDRLDLQTYVREHPGLELPFLAWQHGILDDVVPWETQGLPFIATFEESRHGYVGQFFNDGHTWPGFLASSNNFDFEAFNFPRNESFPAFSFASMSEDPESGETGCRNCCLEWSSSVNSFADEIKDTTDRWEVVVRIIPDSSCPDSGTVDITPRRLQRFTLAEGCTVRWNNIRLSDLVVIQSGIVIVDSANLATVQDFKVTRGGNILRLEKEIQPRKGDVNLDGLINVVDVVRMINIILDIPPEPTEHELWASDLNEDGTINIIDVVLCVNLMLNQ